MKVYWGILAILVIIFALLVALNPSKEEFTEWVIEQYISDNPTGWESYLSESLAKPLLQQMTERKNYLIFSIYRVEGFGEPIVCLGVCKLFMVLSKT